MTIKEVKLIRENIIYEQVFNISSPIDNIFTIFGGPIEQQFEAVKRKAIIDGKRADNVVQVACTPYTTWCINESSELYGILERKEN